MNKGRKSSSKDTFLTPEWILDLVREFGVIELDPATNVKNTTGAKCCCVAPDTDHPEAVWEDTTTGVIYVKDGLAQDWHIMACEGLVWVNPPFIHKAAFLKKATEEFQKGAEILMIIPSDPTAKWWQTWVSPNLSPGCVAVCHLSKRPTFLDPETGRPPLDKDGKETSAMFGCDIAYFGSDIEKFRAVFGPHGDIYVRPR